MRHAPTQLIRSIALAVALLALAGGAAQAQTPTPTPNPLSACAGKLNGALRNYTNNVLQYLTQCSLNALSNTSPCTANAIKLQLGNFASDFSGQLTGCSNDALFELCPLNAKTTDPAQLRPMILAALTTVTDSFESKLAALNDDLFTTSYAGCARPSSTVASSTSLYKCASQFNKVIPTEGDALEACFFSCELGRLITPRNEICVDDITGDPLASNPTTCKTKELGNVGNVGGRCSDAQIVALGCPLGVSDVASLISEVGARLTELTQQLNLDVYHSDCQGNLPGGPPAPVPAPVTLEPSLTHKQVTCGQTIDSTFMGADNTISFDADLDCSGAKTATDGLIIAQSGVVVNGRAGKIWSITGPARSSLRTGAGIRLAPGVSRVQIKNMKAIQNFGIGILDADEANNRNLVIVKTTVRRNVIAGIRLRSSRAKIDTVTADKNGIGMDLSGDGIKVKASDIKGSLYLPKVGLQLGGVDKNGDGKIVQVAGPLNVIELNEGVGILITQGGHTISQATVKDNLGNGIEIQALGVGSLLDTNSVKTNGGDGIVVDGDSNQIDTNTSEENVGAGFVVGGNFNKLLNNTSGQKTTLGNGDEGYLITGLSVDAENNVAEANMGSGFVLSSTSSTTVFKSNSAQSNFEHGFDIESSGNLFDTCSAEQNNQADPKSPALPFHQWMFVAGQSEVPATNSAGGDTIGLPTTAGFCDKSKDCPKPK